MAKVFAPGRSGWCAAVLMVATIFAHSALAATKTAGTKPSRAAKLVAQALQAQAKGDLTRHDALLDQALKIDPDFGPARWHLGQVFFEGQWRSLQQIERLVDSEPRWREYRELRQKPAESAEDHTELAKWCRRNDLAAAERSHWLLAYASDPGNELARNRLGLRPYGDGFYTPAEIAAEKKRLRQAKAEFEEFKPRIEAICRRIERGPEAECESALAELRQVDDIRAMDALEFTVARVAEKVSSERAVEMHIAVVAALSNMSQSKATARLLDYAVFAGSPDVRSLAAASLKTRPVTQYIPQLMAALAAPIEYRVDAVASPDGTVSYGESFFQAGPESDREYNFGGTYRWQPFDPDRPAEFYSQVARNLSDAQRRQRDSEAIVVAANLETQARNLRIRSVLAQLDVDLGDDPEVYWQAWANYNELSYSDHPTITIDDINNYIEPVTHSCFMAGTPVWTPAGATPIEQIAVGDLVLAQHPTTGEIAFRPVTEKTIGPPTKTVELRLPGETLVATPGHRLWVSGQGWEMVKSLAASMSLHSFQKTLPIEATAPGDELQCHNMVVDDFHTFFVGKSRILAHDKTCPRATTGAAPGMTTPVTASADQTKGFADYARSLAKGGLR